MAYHFYEYYSIIVPRIINILLIFFEYSDIVWSSEYSRGNADTLIIPVSADRTSNGISSSQLFQEFRDGLNEAIGSSYQITGVHDSYSSISSKYHVGISTLKFRQNSCFLTLSMYSDHMLSNKL